MKNYEDKLTFTMSRQRAQEFGLLRCSCGHPENNHFGAANCARCDCKKYAEVVAHAVGLEAPVNPPPSAVDLARQHHEEDDLDSAWRTTGASSEVNRWDRAHADRAALLAVVDDLSRRLGDAESLNDEFSGVCNAIREVAAKVGVSTYDNIDDAVRRIGARADQERARAASLAAELEAMKPRVGLAPCGRPTATGHADWCGEQTCDPCEAGVPLDEPAAVPWAPPPVTTPDPTRVCYAIKDTRTEGWCKQPLGHEGPHDWEAPPTDPVDRMLRAAARRGVVDPAWAERFRAKVTAAQAGGDAPNPTRLEALRAALQRVEAVTVVFGSSYVADMYRAAKALVDATPAPAPAAPCPSTYTTGSGEVLRCAVTGQHETHDNSYGSSWRDEASDQAAPAPAAPSAPAHPFPGFDFPKCTECRRLSETLVGSERMLLEALELPTHCNIDDAIEAARSLRGDLAAERKAHGETRTDYATSLRTANADIEAATKRAEEAGRKLRCRQYDIDHAKRVDEEARRNVAGEVGVAASADWITIHQAVRDTARERDTARASLARVVAAITKYHRLREPSPDFDTTGAWGEVLIALASVAGEGVPCPASPEMLAAWAKGETHAGEDVDMPALAQTVAWLVEKNS